MVEEQVKQVAIRPFGEGGEELGMTRAEMLDHINVLEGTFSAAVGSSVEFLFAWLVAMFFIAHRLSKLQFLVASGIYLLLMSMHYFSMVSSATYTETWKRYAGFNTQLNTTGAEKTFLDSSIELIQGGQFASIVYWGVIVISIWWAFSCRENQPKDIGSPL